MSIKARLFLLLVIIGAALLPVIGLLRGLPLMADLNDVWVGVAWCVGIGMLAEVAAVDLRAGLPAKPVTSSLAFLPFLSALILFSLSTAIGAIAVVCVFANLLRRTRLWIALFNIAQAVVAGFVAGSAYHAVMSAFPPDLRYWSYAPGFLSLAFAFFLVNMFLSSIAVTLLRGVPFREILQQLVGSGGGNLLYDLAATPIAAVTAILYNISPQTGIGLILLPLLLIHRSYAAVQIILERNKDLLRALVRAIETRDPYTSGHSVRVQLLAKAIAEDFGLRSSEVHNVETAALLHDIGKIDQEFASVLRKPYNLTAEERELIETHATRGADLLQELKSVPEIVVLSVRHHHERFDGTGYPDGLAGHAIPLPARIIMLCDAIDAMLSDRPYRSALSADEVLEELQRCRGAQFDPALVDVVLRKATISRAVNLIRTDAAGARWTDPAIAP
jgi:putative nucleotidyltransferase with HDIG domain